MFVPKSTNQSFSFGNFNNAKNQFGTTSVAGSTSFGNNPSSTNNIFGATSAVSNAPFGGAPSVTNTPFGNTNTLATTPFGNTNTLASTPFGNTNTLASTPFGVSASVSTTPFTLNKPPTSLGFGNTFNTNMPSNTTTGFGNSGFQASVTPFGAKPTGFNTGFGTTNTSVFSSQPNNTTQVNETDLFLTSITYPALCGDDRDMIIQRWNQLQAMYGCGNGLSCKGKIIYTQENPISRFKSVAFNKIPKTDDNDGFVAMLIKKSFNDVSNNKIAIKEKIYQIINIQTIKVEIEDVRPAIKVFSNPIQPVQNKPTFGFQQPNVQPLANSSTTQSTSDEYTEIFIKIVETLPNGTTRYVAASNLANHFRNEPFKTKLFNELSVIDVLAHVSPTSKDISDYLNGPAPRGLDVELWEKAKTMCNGDVSIVPVPIIGMSELKARMHGQIEFANVQLATIRKESESVGEMKTKIVSMTSKIDQMKRKQMELNNRILKIFCRKEALQKQGYTLSAEEETLKCTLDKLWLQIVGPQGLKSRLQEITSSPKISCGYPVVKLPSDSLSRENIEELKEYFAERHQSIKEMMKVLRENIACLNIIEKSC